MNINIQYKIHGSHFSPLSLFEGIGSLSSCIEMQNRRQAHYIPLISDLVFLHGHPQDVSVSFKSNDLARLDLTLTVLGHYPTVHSVLFQSANLSVISRKFS